MPKLHPHLERAFQLGLAGDGPNTFLASSDCFEAFELGRRAMLEQRVGAVLTKRGARYTVTCLRCGPVTYRFRYDRRGIHIEPVGGA